MSTSIHYPSCPHCHLADIHWSGMHDKSTPRTATDENNWQTTCPGCSKPYLVQREVVHHFASRPLVCPTCNTDHDPRVSCPPPKGKCDLCQKGDLRLMCPHCKEYD